MNLSLQVMRRINERSLRGFTLIELVVAASIAAILGLVIVSTFAAGFNVFGQLKKTGIAEAEVLLSFQKIEKDLKSLFYFNGINFRGGKREVSFAGFVHGSFPVGRIVYFFDPGIEGALIRVEQPLPGAVRDERPDSREFQKIVAVKDLAFSYYYFNPEAQEYGWYDTFNIINGVPAQVKIRAVFQEGQDNVEREKTVLIPIFS